MVGMQGIGWCDMGMGFLCVSGCSAVWVEIGAECVARESGAGWRIFANFGGIVATPLAFRAEMLASRGALCVTLHHRNATTPSDPANPIRPCKAYQTQQSLSSKRHNPIRPSKAQQTQQSLSSERHNPIRPCKAIKSKFLFSTMPQEVHGDATSSTSGRR